MAPPQPNNRQSAISAEVLQYHTPKAALF